MTHEITEDLFLKEVANHEMTVLKDEGIYRHVRFKKPGTYCMHFDLVTWPGYLAYSGDMGCYVFSRLDDMFQFFRCDREDEPGRTLFVNHSYWAEKIEALDSNGKHANGATEFDEERFEQVVREDTISWIRDHAHRTTKEERRDLYDAVIAEVINADGDKQCAAHDFSYHVNKTVGDFYFRDFSEHTLTKWTSRFQWCCYALAWGIKKYDEAKQPAIKAAA